MPKLDHTVWPFLVYNYNLPRWNIGVLSKTEETTSDYVPSLWRR